MSSHRTAQGLATALLLLLCQCATGPELSRVVVMAKGDRVLVSIQSGPIRQSLINESAVTPEQADEVLRADRDLKIIPDAMMQALLDLFGGQEFFRLATPQEPGSKVAHIRVEHNGKSFIATGRQRNAEDLTRWGKCLNRFTDVYNVKLEFRGGRSSSGELSKSRDEVEREYQKRTRKQ